MKIETIKRRADFVALSKSNIKYFSKNIIISCGHTPLDCQKKDEKISRIGYVITKKVGNAVVRNKIKRRCRHIIREDCSNLIRHNYDYIIIAKKQIMDVSFDEIRKDIIFCLKRLSVKYNDG